MMTSPLETLTREQAQAVAALIAMGAQGGVTVLGLSGVRRTREVRVVFLDVTVSQNTQQELGKRTRSGCRVFLVDGLEVITSRMGREDARVLAVKPGPLADGVMAKLPLASPSPVSPSDDDDDDDEDEDDDDSAV
ncbi:MAG: hypothetical protein HN712_06155 [Gemmatimonadetes bacterium]|jgi:hypothetical protein|nr:hypothetical protein [Gemmatimonadota bacterium]MBT7859875.1 hypothetical protein [Gemmatimonadota bacterium]